MRTDHVPLHRSNGVNVGSLFSGIGGFDLGFERAGLRTAWFVERDPFCTAVLNERWPGVPVYDDVCTVGADVLEPVDLLCGGFPCQDLSAAGKGAGLDGARSGLWAEFARLIGELRPRYVVVENVPMLRSRGLGRVLGEMAALGYDAEWDCVPASAVGAPHRRDRIWIVAYPQRSGLEGHGAESGQPQVAEPRHGGSPVADPEGERQRAGLREAGAREEARRQHQSVAPNGRGPGGSGAVGNPDGSPSDAHPEAGSSRGAVGESGRGAAEPGLGGVADGVPHRLDSYPWFQEPEGVPRTALGVEHCKHRLMALGNALVPQIAEEIGRRIMAYEGLA